MRNYENDRSVADGYLSPAKELLRELHSLIKNKPRPLIFRRATEDEDQFAGADFCGYSPQINIAWRNRYDVPFRDLTIRAHRLDRKTELAKIQDGYTDYYIYCWIEKGKMVEGWIVDCRILVKSGLLDRLPLIMNKDNTTGFVAISKQMLVDAGALMFAKVYREREVSND